MKKSLSTFDICCGAGIFSAGFKGAGFKVLGGIDLDKHAIDTAKQNMRKADWKQMHIEGFANLLVDGNINTVSHADVLLAGLPCQGFSIAGTRDPKDERNQLYKHLLKIVATSKPPFVVVENVQGLVNDRNSKIFNNIVTGLANLGYDVDHRVYDAVNFGTPQYRRRVIIIGSLSIPAKYIFAGMPLTGSPTTVSEALKYLPATRASIKFNHTFMEHSKAVIRKIAAIDHAKIISYRRLKPNSPSLTITSGHNALPLHPVKHRAISNREAARLQGVPDSFIFTGPRTEQTVQIANAVPFPMAEGIGKAIKKASDTMASYRGILYKTLVSKTSKKKQQSMRKGFVQFYKKSGLNYPWRRSSNAKKILFTEIMLQRTNAKMVKPLWNELIGVIKPKNKAEQHKLKRLVNKLGIFKRVETIENLHEALKQLHKGSVPEYFEELMALPGVGIYISSAVRTFAYGIPDFPVDANAYRFIGRFFDVKIKSTKPEAKQIREFMNEIISKRKPKEFVYGFLDFGATVCAPKKPKCQECFLKAHCAYYKKNKHQISSN